MFDPIPYTLALAFVDNAFDLIESLEALFEQRFPKGNKLFQLRWKASMLDAPVFRAVPDHI